jgi:hypothetical protein
VLRLPRKLQLILRKRRKSIAPATHTHKNDFRHLTKHVTKRSYATLETSKNDSFCRTYYGMAIRPSRERLRTVRQRRANTPSPPQTPRVKQEPLLRIREKSGGLNPNLVLINTTSFADPAPQRQAALAGSWSSDRSNHLPVQSWFHHGVNKGLQ